MLIFGLCTELQWFGFCSVSAGHSLGFVYPFLSGEISLCSAHWSRHQCDSTWSPRKCEYNIWFCFIVASLWALSASEKSSYGPCQCETWSKIWKKLLGRRLTAFRNWEHSCGVGVFQHHLLLQYFVLSIWIIFPELECPEFNWLTSYFMTSLSACQEVKITNPKWKYCAGLTLGANLELCS